MIVTIDGPAGAGKSSLSRQVAEHLKFAFLDTGAMYRCVTYEALRQAIDFDNHDALAAIAKTVNIDFNGDRIILNQKDVTEVIRMPEVTCNIRHVADHPEIRERLNVLQRRFALRQDTVTEGRDQGTEVFPDADCKIFLTASAEERARRRQRQLAESGKIVSVEQVLSEQNRRDLEDQTRAVGRLRAADDAVIVNSDGKEPKDVVKQILQIVRRAQGSLTAGSSH